MADPLSLAASIAGLISLADIAFKHAYKFVRAAKDAKDDILSLTDEINNLASVLRVLEALASDLEAEGDQFDPTLRNHYLNHCFKTLTRIETRLKKAAESFTRSKLESICRQLKWPFSSSETKDLLAELSRHKETINVALAADTMRKLQLSLSKSDELAKKISAVGEIVRRIEINTLIDVNTQKQRVLDYFMKTNPQTNLETSIRLRHSMTGLWLTESPTFTRWLETPSSKLWLTGIPGAGKTVLAGSVIQEALSRSYSTQNIGVAFFFCDYKDPTTWQTVDILGAVISQLARQKDEAFDVLCSYYGHLHPPKRLAQAPDPDELRARINQISEVFDQIIIVVDGLDECGDLADDVVDALIQVADYSERTSMAIFSRDHYDIRVHLEQDFEVIPIAAHTDDVRLYVNAEIDKRIRSRQLQLTSADIREEIQEVLVGRADGMFRWVVCQIDYLCDCAHDGERREALSKLPPDLPESYRRLLERVNRCSPRVQEVVQMCLHFMTVTEPKLTILELRQAVSAPSAIGESLDEGNTVSEQEITRRCSSLIRNSSDGKYFEFAHFSVREFLEDRSSVFHSVDLERYWISKPTTSYLLAAQCLRFLQMRNFDEMPTDFEDQLVAISERNEEYPFYMHAAVLWIKLTKDGLDDSTLFDLAKSLFKPSKRVHFMYWAIAVLDSLILATGFKYGPGHRHERVRQGWKMVTLPSFRPLHMAAALNLPEICISLIHEGSDVNTRFSVASTLDLALITIVAIPGLADLCSTIPRERNLISSVNDRFLPISKRRNMTIDCLIQAGSQPSSRPIPPNTLSVFSITCLLAAMFNDLSPIIRVLSCHISPSLPEVRVLTSWIETTDSSDHEAELSAREILQYLKSTDSYCSDWGKEVGSIVWDWVIDSKFSLARDLSLANSYISVSEDALVVQLLSAISSDNVDLLRYCLADSRLKDQAAYSGPVHTLLHMAVRNNAFGAFKLLVDEGYNPYTQNDEGDLPIHLCDRRHRPLPFKVFKDLGISFLSRNRNGHNILHLWAQDRLLNYQFVSDLFDLDPEATIDGLQMRTDGHTPLALIFRRAGETPFEELEPDLSKLCSQISLLLYNHSQQSSIATDLESEGAASMAMETSPEFRAMIESEPTPLHDLNPWVSLEQLQLLIRLYPHAANSRYSGRLPVETYIMKRIGLIHRDPNTEIVEALFPQDPIQSHLGAELTLWSFVCYPPVRAEARRVLYADTSKYSATIALVFRLGAMEVHEQQLQESGLIPLLAPHRIEYIPTIRDAIPQTRYWASMRSSDSLSSLFRHCIFQGDLGMIRLLLEHGADLHHRVNGQSPIETAFLAPAALRICSSEDGTALFEELLGRSTSEELVGISPFDHKSSLLHTLATPEDVTSILWLAEALVQRGVDVNQVGSGFGAEPAIDHHLRTASFQFAELLLNQGADISNDASFSNAIHMAILYNNAEFLRTVLSHKGNMSVMFDWVDPVGLIIESADRKISTTGGGILHTASYNNSFDCLKLVFDGSLKLNKALMSDERFTPVHISAYKGFVEVTGLFLANGFDVTAESEFGYTPLHMAVRGRSLPTVKFLLEHGASDSLDAFGKTPRRLAFELEFVEIYNFLEQAAKDSEKLSPFISGTCLSGRHIQRMGTALEKAVREDDYDTIQLLLDSGCPIDIPLPASGSRSALTLSLDMEELEMAEWLLASGASALTADDPDCKEGAIELASTWPDLERILPELVKSYFEEGGDLFCGDEFPFHDAVMNDNDGGLEALIYAAEDEYEYPGSGRKLGAILDRQTKCMFRYDNDWPQWRPRRHVAVAAPLHVASWKENKLAASLLADKGADINAADVHGRTPMMYARSADMAQHLISLGASIAAVCRCGSLPALISWFGPQVFCELYPIIFSRLPGELLTAPSMKQFPTGCEPLLLSPTCLEKLYELKYDLLTEDETGRSMMHCIMCEDNLTSLVLDNDEGLNGTSPFPWHLEWTPFAELAFLDSSFERFREKVPRETFQAVLNLEPSRGWSPLCRAASLNLVDMVTNCLKMGADIDFEGCALGSAVMIASACGSLDAVKHLVRNGASVLYTTGTKPRSCYLLAGTKDVRAWLLSGRFRDQSAITYPAESENAGEEAFWSGYVQARLMLYGTRARAPTESSLDYAKRLAEIRKHFEGQVLPLDIEYQGWESESESESDSDSESEYGSWSESGSGSGAGSGSELELGL